MVSIRPYEDKDFEAMFAAFNARVAWLTSKGLEGQWGALPWGEDRKTRLRSGIPGDTKGVWVAVVDGESAGWLVITPYRSDYIPVTADDKPGKECFIKVLLVHPKFAGRGIGDRLLELAKESAIKDKAEWLRLDCWRGPEGKEGLVKYYEAKGFTKARAFATPKGDGSEWTERNTGFLLFPAMHFFRPKPAAVEDRHDSQRMEIVLDHDFLFLRGTGSDCEPALMSGNVVLHLNEPTTLRSITLQFRGKAYISQPPQQDSLSSNNPTSTYILCKHNWSFLEGAKKNSYTLKAGVHLFPFKLQVGGSLPSSLVTDSMGGASVAYKLRAVAERAGFSHNIQAVAPVYILRSLSPSALEFQQTRDIEYTWMNKLMFYIAIPHVAWAAGDELVALLKLTPLVKGVGVLSVTTSLRETTKFYNRPGTTTRKVATVTHEILGGKAVEISEPVDPKESRFLLPLRSATPAAPSQSAAEPRPVSTGHTTPPEPTQGEDDVVTTLNLRIPSQSTPSHSHDPIHVSYVIHWSVLVTNADGHISELFCSLPISILDSYLLSQVRRHTSLARRLLIGEPETPPHLDDKSELPSYLEHVRDRVANMALSEANTLRVTNPWVQMGVSPTIVDGQKACSAPLEVISDGPYAPDPSHPVFLDWVNAELLISHGATKAPFPTNAEAEGSGYNTPIPHPDHPTPTIPSAEGVATYTHPSHASDTLHGIFVPTMEPASSFSHPAWLTTRPDPKSPRNLSTSSLSSAETVQRRVREVTQTVPNVNSELLHRAFTEVPDYEVAMGFKAGLPPLSSLRGLPSYKDSEASRSGSSVL